MADSVSQTFAQRVLGELGRRSWPQKRLAALLRARGLPCCSQSNINKILRGVVPRPPWLQTEIESVLGLPTGALTGEVQP